MTKEKELKTLNDIDSILDDDLEIIRQEAIKADLEALERKKEKLEKRIKDSKITLRLTNLRIKVKKKLLN